MISRGKSLTQCSWGELMTFDRMVRLNQLQLRNFNEELQEEMNKRKNGRR